MLGRVGRKVISSREELQTKLSGKLPTREAMQAKLSGVISSVDTVTGLNEVKSAQAAVFEAERKFQLSQATRRALQEELHGVNSRIKSVSKELDRVPRGEEKHLDLVIEEHTLVKEQVKAAAQVESADFSEKENFALLSATLRVSYEKERAYSEKARWWSLGGSIGGAMIGMLGSTFINRWRLDEIRQIILNGQENNAARDTSMTMENGLLLEVGDENSSMPRLKLERVNIDKSKSSVAEKPLDLSEGDNNNATLVTQGLNSQSGAPSKESHYHGDNWNAEGVTQSSRSEKLEMVDAAAGGSEQLSDQNEANSNIISSPCTNSKHLLSLSNSSQVPENHDLSSNPSRSMSAESLTNLVKSIGEERKALEVLAVSIKNERLEIQRVSETSVALPYSNMTVDATAISMVFLTWAVMAFMQWSLK